MKSFVAAIAVFVLWASGATAAPQAPDSAAPQPTPPTVSAPTLIRVDGRLASPTGEARKGQVVMVVSLYAEKGDTTPLWTEHQLVTPDDAGGYSVFAGATLPDGVPKEVFSLTTPGRWLGVGVQGEPEQMRMMLVTVPYALKAREAETLAGKPAGDFVLSENLTDTVKSTLKAEGVITKTKTDPSTPSAANFFLKDNGAGGSIASTVAMDDGVNVGIGTGSPGSKLQVNGALGVGSGIFGGLAGSIKAGNTNITSFDSVRTIGVWDAAAPSFVAAGQDNTHNAQFTWNFNGTPANASAAFQTYGYSNPFFVDASNVLLQTISTGRVGIGTAAPGAKLQVNGAMNVGAGPVGGLTGSIKAGNVNVTAFDTVRTIGVFDSIAPSFVAAGQSDSRNAQFAWIANATPANAYATFQTYGFSNPFRMDASAVILQATSAGFVGIGTNTPTQKLDVVGNVTVSGNIGAKYQDVAEWVETDTPLEAGTVVIVDPREPNRVKSAPRAYDTRVAGAISRQPGLILGEKSDTNVMVAQSGRVRIKADARYGAIRIGDLLVTSPTPGHAMRSRPVKVGGHTIHRPGTLLGKALEALPNGKGEILVLLTLQ